MQTYRQIASSDIATAGGELTANAMPLAGGVLTSGNLSAGSVTPTGGSSQTLAYWLSTEGLASLLASPPAIGGTTPAAGSFTTLSATGGISGSAVSAIAPGCGYASINGDNHSNSGYLAFFNSSGVRQGYIGFASNAGGPHNIQSEGSATGYAMNGLLTVGGTLTVSGATTLAGLTVASGGIYLGSALAASVTDLSKHISLYGDTLGFSITGGRLNTVVPAGMLAVTNVGGTDILTVGGTSATVNGTVSSNSLSVSGTVSGAGFNTLFASPPAIGGTTPAAGSFTTMSVGGTLTVSGGYTYLNGAAATNRFNMYQTAGVNRWGVGGAGDTESGGNTGTSFAVGRYTDAGAYIDEPLIISRATGLVSIIDGASVSNGLTVASGGIYLGSALAASVTDLSKHISLFGDTLGFSVTGGRLNTVVPAGMLAVTNVGGTDILTVASTGATVTNMTVTGTLTAASYVAPGATSNIGRNRIDNGNMEIAQRTLPVTVNNAYGLDRWIASWSSGTASVSQGAYGGYTSRKQLVLAITGLTSGTTAGAYHRIEAARSCDLAGQTVTVQFNATLTNTGTGGTFSVQPYYAGPLDNFAGNVAIGSPIPFTLSGTPVTYTATFAVPSAAVNGLQLNFLITQGTTGNIAFVITSVQLEAGAAATAFERLDPVLNLQRCQRFYQNSSYQIQAYHLGGSYCSYVGAYPVQLRATPTIAVASISNVNCSVGTVSAGPGSDGNSYYTINVGVTATGGCNCAGTFTASADL